MNAQYVSIKSIKLVVLAVALFAAEPFNSRAQLAASIVQQAYIKASNTGGPSTGESGLGAGDNFGRSVAISGDTMVIGAVGEDSNATGVNGNQTNNSATDSGAASEVGSCVLTCRRRDARQHAERGE